MRLNLYAHKKGEAVYGLSLTGDVSDAKIAFINSICSIVLMKADSVQFCLSDCGNDEFDSFTQIMVNFRVCEHIERSEHDGCYTIYGRLTK